MPVFGKRSLNSLEGIHPDMVRLMHEAIKGTPVDFTITDGLRTVEQQKALYAKGRTAAGSIVTNADGVKKKSNHQSGKAVDLYPYVNGAIDFNDKGNNFPILAAHIKAVAKCLGIGVVWGGDFKSILDKPHWELK